MDENRDDQVDPNAASTPNSLTADGAPMGDSHDSDESAETATASDSGSSVTSTVGNVARNLKPVAEAAENVAGHAVKLSAKGINWLDATLADRRKQRKENGAISESLAPTAEHAQGGDTTA